MKLGSLFDGIGGFPKSAEIHGIEPVWASEIEPFPIKVTKKHFPNMKHLGDITKVNGAEIELVDIITFGSPCTRLSVAGKHDGFDITFICEGDKENPHEKYINKIRATDKYQYIYAETCPICGQELIETNESALFFHAIRIISEMRVATNGMYPRIAIWENVPGAFSSNGGQDFKSVLEELTESEIPMPASGKWANAGMVRGNGRSAAWRVLDAQYHGVPQRRRRIFLVTDFAGQRAGEILFECQGLSRDIAESGESGKRTATNTKNGIETASGVDIYNFSITGDTACTLNANSGCSSTHAGPSVIERVIGLDTYNQCLTGNKAKTINSSASDIDYVGGVLISDIREGIEVANIVLNDQGGSSINIENGISPTLRAETHGNLPCVIAGTVSAKWAKGTGGPAGNECQNLVAVENHPAGSRVKIDESGTIQTLTGRMGTGGGNVPMIMDILKENMPLIQATTLTTNYTIRRLTPTECERLQGYPDGWTEDGSDTGRYKALGNSVAVPCVVWIIGQVKEALSQEETG